MPSPQIRGVELFEELANKGHVRDTRPLSKRITDWMKVPTNLASSVLFIAIASYFVPALSDVCLLIAVGLFAFGMTSRKRCRLNFLLRQAF